MFGFDSQLTSSPVPGVSSPVPGILKSASVFGCPLHEQQLDEVFIISLKAVQNSCQHLLF